MGTLEVALSIKFKNNEMFILPRHFSMKLGEILHAKL